MSDEKPNGWGSLTGKQRAFITAWFSNGYNAQEAARAAGYGGDEPSDAALRAQGSRTLTNANVQDVIRELWAAENGVTEEEVRATLARQMRGGPGDFMDKYGRMDLEAIKERGAGVVKSVKIDKGNKVEIQLESSQRAAELIGKSMGMFVERQEISGPDGGPIMVKTYVTVSPDDWDETD